MHVAYFMGKARESGCKRLRYGSIHLVLSHVDFVMHDDVKRYDV